MNSFFSVLGPTNVEIDHAHARENDCTEVCSQAVESDSRGTTRIVVRCSERGDGRTPAEFVATGTWVDWAKHSESGAQTCRSADGQRTHWPGSASDRGGVAAHVVPGRAARGDCGGLVESRAGWGVLVTCRCA